MNTFLDCISGKEGVLFIGPLILLLILEVTLCITYLNERRRLRLIPIGTRNGRQEEDSSRAVSEV